MSELTSPFRLLTGEILPSGWTVCLQKKKETKGGGDPTLPPILTQQIFKGKGTEPWKLPNMGRYAHVRTCIHVWSVTKQGSNKAEVRLSSLSQGDDCRVKSDSLSRAEQGKRRRVLSKYLMRFPVFLSTNNANNSNSQHIKVSTALSQERRYSIYSHTGNYSSASSKQEAVF